MLQRRGTRVVGLSRSPSQADEHEECDVSDRDAVAAAAARVVARHPEIDLLVNNSGVGARGSFLSATPERIEEVVRVNYLGSVWTTLAFLPALGRGSHVANVVSVAGTFANGPYSASKHAQLAFSRSVSSSLRGRGISVHTVNPGFVETEGFPQRSVLGNPMLRRVVIDADDVARHIVQQLDRGPTETVVPRWYRIASVAQGLAPNLMARIGARVRV